MQIEAWANSDLLWRGGHVLPLLSTVHEEKEESGTVMPKVTGVASFGEQHRALLLQTAFAPTLLVLDALEQERMLSLDEEFALLQYLGIEPVPPRVASLPMLPCLIAVHPAHIAYAGFHVLPHSSPASRSSRAASLTSLHLDTVSQAKHDAGCRVLISVTEVGGLQAWFWSAATCAWSRGAVSGSLLCASHDVILHASVSVTRGALRIVYSTRAQGAFAAVVPYTASASSLSANVSQDACFSIADAAFEALLSCEMGAVLVSPPGSGLLGHVLPPAPPVSL